MNRYIAFWRGKRVDVDADTSCRAQQIAARKFKAKQTYEVTVILAEKDVQVITHDGSELS